MPAHAVVPCTLPCHANLHRSSTRATPTHATPTCALYRSRVQVYGRPGDLAALREELAIAPEHTLLLWPGEGALTVGRHVESEG